jgi:hypothetical protein
MTFTIKRFLAEGRKKFGWRPDAFRMNGLGPGFVNRMDGQADMAGRHRERPLARGAKKERGE